MKYYVSVLITDDGKAKEDCDQYLVFGEPARKDDESIKKSTLDFDWKHVELPCPSCGFSHNFKRQSWIEEIKLNL